MGIFKDKIQRPNNEYLDRLKKSVYSYAQIISDYKEYDSNLKQQINSTYNRIILSEAMKLIAHISIDALKGSGIRLQVLKDNGIFTLGELRALSLPELIAINGIGRQNANTIITELDKLSKTAAVKVDFRIDLESDNQDYFILIKNLYDLIKTESDVKNVNEIGAACEALVSENLQLVEAMPSALLWLVTSRDKKLNSINAVAKLEAFLNGNEIKAVYQYDETIKNITSTDEELVLKDYETNSGTYYAWLEDVIGVTYDVSNSKNSDSEGENSYINMPAELAGKINRFELDTSMMKSKLRKYQEFGSKFALHQKKVLIGDEMGLGKTIQAIACMAHLRAKGATHFLVVCPLSVLINWTREIEQHSELVAKPIYGDKKDEQYNSWVTDGGVAITNYETLNFYASEIDLHIEMMVVDEAHYVKNESANRTISVNKVASFANYVIYMTGTPLENKVDEMIYLISCLQKDVAESVKDKTRLMDADVFKEDIAPVYLRRTRHDVLKELPDIIEVDNWGHMNDYEVNDYIHRLQFESMMSIRQHSWKIADMSLSSKMNRLFDICDEAKFENRRVVVFSYFLDTLDIIKEKFGSRAYGPINGSVPAIKRQGIIDDFSNSEAGSLLICQIQAGGIGLNIQAASVVVICEPQFKPSIEYQAIARAYRMGQVKDVIVHRLLMEGTIDERIKMLLDRKQEVFDVFADDSALDNANEEIDNSLRMKILEEELKKYNIERDSKQVD